MSQLMTISGQTVNLTNPDPATIHSEDIAHALSNLNRYGGHTHIPFSVGQHTLAVVFYLVAIKAPVGTVQAGLIHDFPEYVLGDVASPLKAVLGGNYAMLEVAWENAICEKYNCMDGHWYRAIFDRDVKRVDILAYEAEARVLTQHPDTTPADVRMADAVGRAMRLAPHEVKAVLLKLIEEYLT